MVNKLRAALSTLIGIPNLVGCEVGVGGGVHALAILKYLDIKRLYLVDPYMRYVGTENMRHVRVTPNTKQETLAYQRLSAYQQKLIWMKDLSFNAVRKINEELDFVYIDGNHLFEYVLKDIEMYSKIVKSPNGLVSGHDYEMDGSEFPHHFCNVKDAVDLYVKNHNIKLHTDGSDWWFIL